MTLKRWAFDENATFCSATFESHVDWHCAGINCLDVLNSSVSSDKSYLFTGSRDDTQEMGI
ncbi:hypothetical protein F2Q69_00039187 [Brassica cretica]|uniref:Uncharacterized protein n=1 Tax=Brassica cretica TaxID=69181 RepID=A0A8S9SFL1_BRACR|nr:hypothetical protein F2Q69_00039187 [Brassica cretica]